MNYVDKLIGALNYTAAGFCGAIAIYAAFNGDPEVATFFGGAAAVNYASGKLNTGKIKIVIPYG